MRAWTPRERRGPEVEPETRYALTEEGVCVAYKILGDGPNELVFSPGWVTNVEVLWEWPECARFFSRLAKTCRVVVYDKQGTGLSDRVATFPTLEARMDDIAAVMRATGMERATLFGPTQGAALSALFAATFPDRTQSFVAYGGFARPSPAADWPYEEGSDQEAALWGRIVEGWGTEGWTREFAWYWGAETRRADPAFVRWLAKLMRHSATPTSAAAFSAAFEATDVRDILPIVTAPTLLLHRGTADDRLDLARTASLMPMARVQELPGDDWSPYLGDPDPMAEAIEAFLVEVRHEESALDRVLATVVFTDIVDSTATAAALGDLAWKQLVERHHTVVRALLARYRGTEVDTAGDGFFATFEGPARAVRFAQACTHAIGSIGLEIRAGVHTGEVQTIAGKAGGMGVVIGARVGSLAGPSEVLVSQTVKDLTAGSGLVFEDAGGHDLKGVPEPWRLFRVVS